MIFTKKKYYKSSNKLQLIGHLHVMSHGSSNSCGVAILLRKGVDCVIHTKILDPLGRYIILKAAIKDKIHILINIYAPIKTKTSPAFSTTY